MSKETNRMLMEMERAMREINRETIGAEFSKITAENLRPVQEMVAKTRANYLSHLFSTAEKLEGAALTPKQIVELKTLRLTYEEALAGAQALQTAISRGYLEVNEKK